MNGKNEIANTLSEVFPFRFLSLEERMDLANDITVCKYKKNEIIIDEKSISKKDVFIVKEGVALTFVNKNTEGFVERVIKKNHYFGERLALFNVPYNFGFKALKDTVCYKIEGDRFLQLLNDSRAFAKSLGNILRDQQGIFSSFEKFSINLMREVTNGAIRLSYLIRLYKELEPALHCGINKSDIDFSALTYAVKRLPENVTTTFAYLLTDDLPTEFAHPDDIFKKITSKARRRNIWEMMPGKNMVLIRGGVSDLVDMVTCLCLYSVEVSKIRYRLHNPNIIIKLNNFFKRSSTSKEEEIEFLKNLKLSDDEVDGIIKVWPENTICRLHQIACHREMIDFNIRRQVHNYYSRRTELWTQQVGQATRELIGQDPADLSKDIKVHIISSNTHSVTNCLNPLLVKNADKIIEWGQKNKNPVCDFKWKNKNDLAYSLFPDYMKENEIDFTENEKEWGIIKLQETASTGIQVQLIDIKKLKKYEIDPEIIPIPKDSKSLIVNIDYAFGEQAEDIIRNLIILFSKNIASINILGKAGALIGARGDILIPTAFVEQTADLFYPINSRKGIDYNRLKSLLPDKDIYTSPLLTVAGTLLQNRVMLNFYKHIWNCIGLEMEGAFYLKQILEARQTGVISKDVVLRFLYYVSDLPLNKETENLTSALSPAEGIPPLYGITREILNSIFEN